MAKTSMINKQQKEPKFSTRAYTRCRLVAAVRTPCSVSTACAAFVSANWRTRERFPASARPAGKEELKCSLTIPLQICSPASGNAQIAKHDTVVIPASNMKKSIAKILHRRRLH